MRTWPRSLYTIAWWLALPLVLLRLRLRARREPGYGLHWGERLGRYAPTADGVDDSADVDLRPVLWVHAVSVGETRAAAPLIEAMLDAYPTHRLLLTHMTPTGRATGAALFGLSPRIIQRYLPYDTGVFVGGLLRHYRPRLCVLVETEVWPNLVAGCARACIPVVLANARLSARSLARGERLRRLLAPAASALSWTGAQTDADAVRLRAFGATPVEVTGSLKFDVVPPPAQLAQGVHWRAQFSGRQVLLLASTRDGEEALILEALQRLPLPLEVLLVLVPRHPQRFDAVADLVRSHGLALERRSELGAMAPATTTRVLLGDSMGELFAWYAAADLAFIGGSLLRLGGQNLIEACAVGTPVLIGPSSFNFAGVTEDAIAAGAALRIDDADSLLATAQALLNDAALRGAMAGAARSFANAHRGATLRTLAGLQRLVHGDASALQD